jgi:hypothetical protein
MTEDRYPRTVRLPFDFGDVVYHRVRKERVGGFVIGFIIVPGVTKVLVKWDGDLNQDEHFFCELTTEFTSSFED